MLEAFLVSVTKPLRPPEIACGCGDYVQKPSRLQAPHTYHELLQWVGLGWPLLGAEKWDRGCATEVYPRCSRNLVGKGLQKAEVPPTGSQP